MKRRVSFFFSILCTWTMLVGSTFAKINLDVFDQPLSAPGVEIKTLVNRYQQPNGFYTIHYPKNWIYSPSEKNSVIFSGPKQTPAFNTLVKIEFISFTDLGSHDVSTRDMIDDLTQQLGDHGKVLAKGNITLPTNPHFKGNYAIITYTYRNIVFKQMQFVLAAKGGFYLWGYTAHKDVYNLSLPVINTMFHSWVINDPI